MPLVKVIRKGITPTIRKVPTSTCAAMLPMTLERVGKEAASENEELTKVEDLNDSFKKFEPKLNFKGNAGPEETEFKAEFRFKSIKDFDPENLQKRQEIKTEDGETQYLRNDIAERDIALPFDIMPDAVFLAEIGNSYYCVAHL